MTRSKFNTINQGPVPGPRFTIPTAGQGSGMAVRPVEIPFTCVGIKVRFILKGSPYYASRLGRHYV
jgi:hypothetical protein